MSMLWLFAWYRSLMYGNRNMRYWFVSSTHVEYLYFLLLGMLVVLVVLGMLVLVVMEERSHMKHPLMPIAVKW